MSTKPRSTAEKPLWSHCNECGQETLRKVVKLIKRSRDFDADRYTVTVGSNWRILQSSGCQEVAMSRIDWCSEGDPKINILLRTLRHGCRGARRIGSLERQRRGTKVYLTRSTPRCTPTVAGWP